MGEQTGKTDNIKDKLEVDDDILISGTKKDTIEDDVNENLNDSEPDKVDNQASNVEAAKALSMSKELGLNDDKIVLLLQAIKRKLNWSHIRLVTNLMMTNPRPTMVLGKSLTKLLQMILKCVHYWK